ncbi:MAG: PepSY domain-containing protein [Planctomycetaceae bacterium]|jgi:uncharacterized iron-regulated membrane protein|nr:PepSY domain-containing protein [Planctomycetaceae bacterium]
MKNFQTIRRVFYEIHLWLGIVSGIIVFLVCLSGAALVFREEVAHFLEPKKYYVDVPANTPRIPIDELLAKLESENPGMKAASVTIPEKANRTISIMFSQPAPQGSGGFGRGEQREGGQREQSGERSQRQRGPNAQGSGSSERGGQREGGEQRGERREGQERGSRPRGEGQDARGERTPREGAPRQGSGPGGFGRGKMFLVNPYTAEVVGEGMGSPADSFFRSMMGLHRTLWISYRLPNLGPRATLGGLIVGIATIVFVVIVLSGLVLWLPRTWKSFAKWRAWKPGFKVRFRKGFWALTYDIHNTAGFYLLIPTLILALTGLCWSFGWYRNAASYVLGDQIFKQRMQRPEKIEPVENGTQPLSVGKMIERQNKLTPGAGDMSISIPGDNETAMVIQKGRTGFFALSIKDKTQWDRYRGTVIPVEHFGKTVEVERFVDKPLGAKIATAVRTLHFGDVTGTSSKIVFFIACLFATSFPVTGVALWIKKLRRRYIKRRKEREAKNAIENEKSSEVVEK